MRRFSRSSFALIGLSVLAPSAASAQGYTPASASAPAGYATPKPEMTGRSMPATAAAVPAPSPAAKPHVHKKRHLCAACQAKELQAQGMPVGSQIIACAHSKNGVCPACQTLLAMPGPVTIGNPAKAEAPGRAVASSGMGQPGSSNVQVAYDPGATPEPAPIGLVQANFAQGGPMPAGAPGMGMGMPAAAQGSQPGRAVVSSGAGSSPYQPRMDGTPRPHILGHLFGWSGIGADRAEEKARKKSETHASIPYNNEGTTNVNELPASMVFGRR